MYAERRADLSRSYQGHSLQLLDAVYVDLLLIYCCLSPTLHCSASYLLLSDLCEC